MLPTLAQTNKLVHVGHAHVFDSDVLSALLFLSLGQKRGDTLRHNGQTVVRLVSEAQLRVALTVDDLFCCAVGVLTSVAYIWKRMEMTPLSGFVNTKGHRRAATVT